MGEYPVVLLLWQRFQRTFATSIFLHQRLLEESQDVALLSIFITLFLVLSVLVLSNSRIEVKLTLRD